MVKAWLTALAVALVLVAGEAAGSQAARQDVSIAMDDGVSIAATLSRPGRRGSCRRLAGDRVPARALRQPPADERARRGVRLHRAGVRRPHVRRARARESGGLVGIDGPREVADIRAIRDWLAARPDVSDTKIGAWGISYGGGAVFNSLVAGVPWAAVVTVETWTDLYSALAPQGLVKSGLVAGLSGSIPDAGEIPTRLAAR